MTTLEKSITSTATPKDCEMINCIIREMENLDGYYGKFCKYHLYLEFKEYHTLLDDLTFFNDSLFQFNFKVCISDLASFIRSFEMLRKKYDSNTDNPNELFVNFLVNSISELQKFKNQLIEPQNLSTSKLPESKIINSELNISDRCHCYDNIKSRANFMNFDGKCLRCGKDVD